MEARHNKANGLVNLGNTCFMNSILQCLFHSPSLVDYIQDKEFSIDLIENHAYSNFTKEFRILNNKLKTSHRAIAPHSFKKNADLRILQKRQDGLMIGHHNDAHEFLELLLDTLHESLYYIPKINIDIKNPNKLSTHDKLALQACKRWKQHFNDKYSKIVELFYGQFITETKNNQKISYCFDPYGVLNLEMPSGNEESSLIQCIDKFMETEEIHDSSSGTKIYRKFRFWNTPENLIITLKRFNYFNGNNKNNKRIHYPSELDLTKYCRSPGKTGCHYRIYGICCHKGSSGSFGHYDALCRPWNQSTWYLYDDENVRKISKTCEIPLTNSAYILFYHRIS